MKRSSSRRATKRVDTEPTLGSENPGKEKSNLRSRRSGEGARSDGGSSSSVLEDALISSSERMPWDHTTSESYSYYSEETPVIKKTKRRKRRGTRYMIRMGGKEHLAKVPSKRRKDS